jgi:hypothetical protein
MDPLLNPLLVNVEQKNAITRNHKVLTEKTTKKLPKKLPQKSPEGHFFAPLFFKKVDIYICPL